MLQRAGDGWACGEVSVAQEHFVTAFCRDHMLTLLTALDQGPLGGEVALFAGVPGEQHELPLLAAAIELAMRGFRVVYLGADLPLPDLGRAAAITEPTLVCQSTQLPAPGGCSLEAWLDRIREEVGPAPWLVLGGPGVEGGCTRHPRALLCPTVDDFVQAWSARAPSESYRSPSKSPK